MNETADKILEELHEDLISHGWLAQAIRLAQGASHASHTTIRAVLRTLLETEEVEIGAVNGVKHEYLAFIGWKGTIDERIQRAMDAVAKWEGHDKEFAYWLCLRKNVDRYEEGL